MATTRGGHQLFDLSNSVLILPSGERVDNKQAPEGQLIISNGELCVVLQGQWHKVTTTLVEERKA